MRSGKSVAIPLAVAATVLAVFAAVAPAKVTNAANTVELRYGLYETGGGHFEGTINAPAYHGCEQFRRVDLYRDGTKVGTDKIEKYPGFSISLTSVPAGTYVAKIKKVKLQKGVYCKAAQSKPITVP